MQQLVESWFLLSFRSSHDHRTLITEIANPKRSRADITHAILKFSDRFCRSIDGKLDPDGPSLTRELTGGARIEGIFNDVFAPAIGDIDILEQVR